LISGGVCPQNLIRNVAPRCRNSAVPSSNFDTCFRTEIFVCAIIQIFQHTARKPITGPDAALTRPSFSKSVSVGEVLTGNAQNGGTVLPIANLMADSESGSPVSYSSFPVTIRLSRLVSEIFGRTDGWTDNADHYYSGRPYCGGASANNPKIVITKRPVGSDRPSVSLWLKRTMSGPPVSETPFMRLRDVIYGCYYARSICRLQASPL